MNGVPFLEAESGSRQCLYIKVVGGQPEHLNGKGSLGQSGKICQYSGQLQRHNQLAIHRAGKTERQQPIRYGVIAPRQQGSDQKKAENLSHPTFDDESRNHRERSTSCRCDDSLQSGRL
jgi:hypothetical protein